MIIKQPAVTDMQGDTRCLWMSGSTVPAGATPARGEGPSGQRGLQRGGGGGGTERGTTRATLDLHHMIHVKGGG
ncbi:hypothetical protein OYC64_019029 [Pagothenia borchgrevinki]|uniref:Uncharacterized protein n=1 Tax=Pagothenia borchgrevinki TaxID=8213 RepID=A0ABD2GSP3_PAGBO